MPPKKIEILLKVRDEATRILDDYKGKVDAIPPSLTKLGIAATDVDDAIRQLNDEIERLEDADAAKLEKQLSDIRSNALAAGTAIGTGLTTLLDSLWKDAAQRSQNALDSMMADFQAARDQLKRTFGKQDFDDQLSGANLDDQVLTKEKQLNKLQEERKKIIKNINEEEGKRDVLGGRTNMEFVLHLKSQLKHISDDIQSKADELEQLRQRADVFRAKSDDPAELDKSRLQSMQQTAREALDQFKKIQAEEREEAEKTERRKESVRRRFSRRTVAIEKQIAEEREKSRRNLELNASRRTGDPTLQSRTLTNSANQVRSPLERQVQQSDRIIKLNERKVSIQEQMHEALREIQRNTENQFIGV